MGQSMTTSSGGSLIKLSSSLKNFVADDGGSSCRETDGLADARAVRGGGGRGGTGAGTQTSAGSCGAAGAYGGGGAGLDIERR